MHGWRIFILFVEKFSYSYLEIFTERKKTISVHLWLLRSLCYPSHISPAMLLASSGGCCQQIYIFLDIYISFSSQPESWYCPGPLPQCSLPRRQQDVGDQLRGSVGREEGVDQGGAGITAEANVWVVSLIFLMVMQRGQASPLRL